MYCKKCGSQIPDGSKFCKYCGANLAVTEKIIEPSGPVSIARPTTQPTRESRKKNKIVPIVLIILALLVVSGIVLFLLLPKNIDVNKYVVVQTSGENGNGYATAYVDYDGMAKKIGHKQIIKVTSELPSAIWMLYGSPEQYTDGELLEGILEYYIDPDWKLSNGDKVKVVFRPGELSAYLEEDITFESICKKLKIKMDSVYETTVSGLTEPNQQYIDPNDSPSADDNSPIGKVTVITDQLRIRTKPTTGSSSTVTAHAQNGKTYDVYDISYADGYTWYCIGEGQYLAGKEGEWTIFKYN